MLTRDQRNGRIALAAIFVAVMGLGLWTTCTSRVHAQEFPGTGALPIEQLLASTAKAQEPPSEALTADATSVLNQSGHSAEVGQVATGVGLGGVQTEADGPTAWEASVARTPGDALDRIEPFASDWLTVQYEIDDRKDQRVLSFEGHSRVAERVDVYGLLELMSSLDQDPARYSLRAGGFFNAAEGPYGAALWYEDFTGSWNDLARFGGFWDVSAGGKEPFCRLIALPVSTDSGGSMARVMFNVALRPRWTLGGFLETSWWGDGGTWTACEPELRYTITKGLWATLEYRRDERWAGEEEGLAIGLKAAL